MERSRAISVLGSILFALAFGTPAAAQSRAPGLSGWWISLDDTFKTLWENGTIVPTEELLIIDDQMRFENRMMGFWFVDPEFCSTDGPCSDAPLVATGRLVQAKGLKSASLILSIEDYRASANVIESARNDDAIRSRTVSSIRQWRISRLDTAEGVLVVRKGDDLLDTRTFLRVDPDRLRRLRAGLMAAELSAVRHWRCSIANATGVEPVVKTTLVRTRGFPPNAPRSPLVEAYMRIASYRQTLIWQGTKPMPDDPDPAQRKRARVAVEELMFERFADPPAPNTVAEQRKSAAAAIYLRLMTGEAPPAAGRAAAERELSSMNMAGRFSEAEVTALKLLLSDSPEAKQLFCKE
jgi:hypothetical protein